MSSLDDESESIIYYESEYESESDLSSDSSINVYNKSGPCNGRIYYYCNGEKIHDEDESMVLTNIPLDNNKYYKFYKLPSVIKFVGYFDSEEEFVEYMASDIIDESMISYIDMNIALYHLKKKYIVYYDNWYFER